DTNTRDREEEETEIDVDGIAENETETGDQVLDSILPDQFESPEQFVEALYPIAKQVEAETGIDARFLLAQSALETGWGKHMIANQGEAPSHNMFGIKADSRWQGDRIAITTTEYREGIPMKEKAYFRAYPSYDESFRDYARFLKGNERYQEALQWVDDPAAFARELQDAGYATDPAYSDKIQRIYNSDFVQSALLSSN
ncbi:MAG: flagellar assembly peptidoglycan hydrolase FlgJ, partial [Pseudomonadales bacterium]|nr:flagellar assembly peptidoglycan hydrolase FlgJ [Pseudomonadales bacterium]